MTAQPASPTPIVAALHDLSCFGRCALTVILPTLSAMGLQAVPVPTALLSTHTGGFTDMHFRDLSDDMIAIADHFLSLRLHFDALYSGFLGSARQIGIVENFFERFRAPDTVVLVDPVMGDDGVLYSTYTKELQEGMKRLCRHADVITPNLTEACFLSGTAYRDTSHMNEREAEAFAASLCDRLHETLGTPRIVLTGLPFDGRVGTFSSDKSAGTEQAHFYHAPRQPKNFPGTGDIFASVLLGKLLSGMTLADASAFAADFTGTTIAHSQNTTAPLRDGVLLERELYRLCPASSPKKQDETR